MREEAGGGQQRKAEHGMVAQEDEARRLSRVVSGYLGMERQPLLLLGQYWYNGGVTPRVPHFQLSLSSIIFSLSLSVLFLRSLDKLQLPSIKDRERSPPLLDPSMVQEGLDLQHWPAHQV